MSSHGHRNADKAPQPASDCWPRLTSFSTTRACTPSASTESSSGPAWPRPPSYSAFGSKDELIRAYLARRHASRQERITRGLARFDSPRERLLGVFEVLTEVFAEPGFRGCAFANASAESPPGGVVETVSDESRAWTRALFADLARAAGVADPGRAGSAAGVAVRRRHGRRSNGPRSGGSGRGPRSGCGLDRGCAPLTAVPAVVGSLTLPPTVRRARASTFLVFFVNGAVLASWVPRIPAVKAHLHLSDGTLGLALLGPAVGALVAMQFAGPLTRRWGSRPVTVIAVLTYCGLLVTARAGAEPMVAHAGARAVRRRQRLARRGDEHARDRRAERLRPTDHVELACRVQPRRACRRGDRRSGRSRRASR